MTTPVYCIGIDPGATGSLALIHPQTGGAEVWPLPATLHGVADLIREVAGRVPASGTRWSIERVSPRPGEGVVSAATFARGVGRIEGCLAMARIPWDEVLPRTWQAALSLSLPRAMSSIERRELEPREVQRRNARRKASVKRAVMDAVTRLYPQATWHTGRGKPTLAAADGLGIAHSLTVRGRVT